MDKPLILILCTGNSCRSQMAEAILRREAGDIVRVESAGSNPAGHVHLKATQVMKEIGIDISRNRSKHVNEFSNRKAHTVITVCGDADAACPIFPSKTVLEIVQENPKGIKHAKLAAAIADRGVYRATAYRRIKEGADAGLIKCKKGTDLYMASDI